MGHKRTDNINKRIKRWIDYIIIRYKIPQTKRIDIIFDTDANSADLRILMSNKLPRNFICQAYGAKKVIQMAHIVQNAFGRNVIMIVDTGGIFNYYINRFEYGINPLVTQLESVIWDEKGKGFDSTIPNDCTDALTYCTSHYFKNPDNLFLPEIKDYYERGDDNVN